MPQSIDYVVGDATRPGTEGSRIIAQICNNKGRWGSGFTVSVSLRWHSPERLYRQWYKAGIYEGTPFQMGEVQFINVGYNPEKLEDRGLWIANMIAQNGLRSGSNPKPVCYDSLRTCLGTLCKKAINLQAEVIMPRIGTGRGGGKWEVIEPMILEELVQRGVMVTVYDPKVWT
jgi:O-acetyl-ADP-ribose deacetylase (regulator of RNase III)